MQTLCAPGNAAAYCRKHHGAIFHTFAVFPVDALKIAGITAEYKKSQFLSHLRFLAVRPQREEIEVHVDCLDIPRQVKPTCETG